MILFQVHYRTCYINDAFGLIFLFVLFLMQHLSEKRLLAGRSENLDELSREQLLDEKLAVQKALLYLEGIFGRPVTRGDRDLVRPLYDRYRALKRLVIRSGPVSK
jgi:hypothetical protein